jgi:hypothetical protein
MARKIVTPAERIDRMIDAYEGLNREAHELMDRWVVEHLTECPGVPAGIAKQCQFTGRAGYTLDIPAALRLLRKEFA